MGGPRGDTRGILEPGSGAAAFSLERRPPDPALAGHVERHWIVRWRLEPGREFVQEILPHPCVNLVGEPGLIAVWGIPLSRSPHRLEGSGTAIGTKFRPGGFAGFVSDSVATLADRSIAPSELWGEPGASLERALAGAQGDPAAHIAAVEAFLEPRLPPPDARFDVVAAVVSEMLVAGPGVGVADLARRHGVSTRTLQRLFRDYVGVGPKWVLKRYRMHEAAERIAAGEADDLSRLALDLGYFDQAHFTRDFSDQIGRPPAAYARACAAAAGRREPAFA